MQKIYFCLFTIILLSSFSFLQAEDIYYVIQVNKIVLIQKNQTPLKSGMTITKHEQLLFKSKDAYLVVSNEARSRFIIQSPSRHNAKGEFIAFVKDAVLPINGHTSLSVRGNSSPIIADLYEYFGDSTFFVIGDQLKFEVDYTRYKTGSNQFFQISYAQHDSVINTKWTVLENRILTISKNMFTDKDAKTIIPEKIEVFWVVRNPRSCEMLTAFRPIFLDEAALKSEYSVIYELIKKQNLSEEEDEKFIFGYFRDVYGKTDENVLTNWLEENFKK